MFETIKKLFSANGKASKSVARSRLSFVLVQDRAGLTNEEMGKFKKEMIAVIERYFVIDEQGFDIDYKRGSDTTTLVINSPVIVRRQENPGFEVGAKRVRNPKKGKSDKVDGEATEDASLEADAAQS